MHFRGGGVIFNVKFNTDISRDFTLDTYRDLCNAILTSGYSAITVEDYLTKSRERDKITILRHDVDKMPKNALEMAKIEKEFGIRSTYYFRTTKNVFKPDLIKQVFDLGHEIGYHYETLVKANGNAKHAIEIFEKELSTFRDICDIKTICMHGNSLSRLDNRDLWKSYNFRDYGIIGEAYLSINFEEILYLSDSGGSWDNSKIRIKDTVSSNTLKVPMKAKGTNDIINMIKNGSIEKLYILAHPDRWNNSLLAWSSEHVSKKIRNGVKLGIIWYRGRKFCSVQDLTCHKI